MYLPNSLRTASALARPREPLLLPIGDEVDRECEWLLGCDEDLDTSGEAVGVPGINGGREGLDRLWLNLVLESDTGAVEGPACIFPKPMVLMSLGWKRPRRLEFFDWHASE